MRVVMRNHKRLNSYPNKMETMYNMSAGGRTNHHSSCISPLSDKDTKKEFYPLPSRTNLKHNIQLNTLLSISVPSTEQKYYRNPDQRASTTYNTLTTPTLEKKCYPIQRTRRDKLT